MSESISLLQELGFTEYEARAYQVLLQYNPATGYELAKISGIPRPNIYPVMQKLEDQGAVVRIASDDTTRYLPIAPGELLKRIDERLQATLSRVGPMLQTVVQPTEASHIWTTEGYDNLLAQARALINCTKAELLIALWPEEAHALAKELEQAEVRNIKITTLCLAACLLECNSCRGQIFQNKVIDTPDARWLLLVSDEKEIIVGELLANQEVTVVRTRQTQLLRMTSWFVQQAIVLSLLLENTDDDLEKYLGPEAKAILSTVFSDPDRQGPDGWLRYMRQLLRSESGTPALV